MYQHIARMNGVALFYFQDTFLCSEIKEIQSNQYLDEQVLLTKTIKKYFYLGLRIIIHRRICCTFVVKTRGAVFSAVWKYTMFDNIALLSKFLVL